MGCVDKLSKPSGNYIMSDDSHGDISKSKTSKLPSRIDCLHSKTQLILI
ncbi:Putative uncharacterized protein [Moritella viscosa]|nr:Putative uncharacterized protein [Moritella viscosa]SHO20638.1 Putative uncharacterized protein [Moritella viscosa]